MTFFIIGVLLGLVGGYFIGRERAERGRARADGKSARDRRADYRTKK